LDKKVKNNNKDYIQVIDAKSLLGSYIFQGIIVVFIIFTTIYAFTSVEGFLSAIMINIPLIMVFKLRSLTIKTQKDGYIIDVKEDKYSFPGGKAADDISDYFNWNFIKQNAGWARSEIPLSSITQINTEDFYEQKYDRQRQKWVEYYTYTLSVDGIDGTITHYMTKAKRNQLYSMLQQTLNMGSPMIIT
jgi:hypothetical protein